MRARRSPTASRLVLLLILLVAPFVVSCGDSGDDPVGPDDPDPPETIQEAGVTAQLDPVTTYVDEALTEAALTEADTEAHRYTFDAATLEADGVELTSGRILLIHGVALRRITSVSESDGEVTVETAYATLPEAFQDAEIDWSQTTSFTPEALESAELVFEGEGLAPTAMSGSTVSWEYEVAPYTVRGELEALGSTARVKLQAIKDLNPGAGEATAAFTAEGTIQAISSAGDIVIEDSETKAFDYENRGMGGDMRLSLAAAGAGNVGLTFKTPEAVIRFPFTIGPIPATLILKAGMVTGIEVVGGASSVTAEVDFSWGGDAGLAYDGTTVSTTASAGLGTASASGGEADLAAPIGQSVSAQWGAVVPIVEVGLFGETIVPYIQPELYLRSYLTWGPVCQRIKVDYAVDGGMNLRFLGNDLAALAEERRIAGPWELEESQDGCADGSPPAPWATSGWDPVEFGPPPAP